MMNIKKNCYSAAFFYCSKIAVSTAPMSANTHSYKCWAQYNNCIGACHTMLYDANRWRKYKNTIEQGIRYRTLYFHKIVQQNPFSLSLSLSKREKTTTYITGMWLVFF